VTAPEPAQERDLRDEGAGTAPPGHFVSAELESDCARFIEQARELARKRAQAVARV
jgi:hypothetical protein